MSVFVRVVAALLTIGALAVGVVALIGGFQDTAPAADFHVQAVMAGDALNGEMAESAPQQQVVNGWTARDLLELEATRIGNIEVAQQRTNELLGYAVAVTALIAALLALSILRPRPLTAVALQANLAGTPDVTTPTAPNAVIAPAVTDTAESHTS